MGRCAGFKPDRTPCERIVGASQRYCYAHDPDREEQRSRNAAKAGRSRPGGETRDLRRRLGGLYADVREGRIPPNVAATLVQIVHARIRLCEFEQRVEYDRSTALTASEASDLRASLAAAVRKHVKDPRVLDLIGRELAAIYGKPA